MRAGFVLLILCSLSFKGIAQRKLLDSLENELSKHPAADTSRLYLLNDIAFTYYEQDPNKGLTYSDEAIELARKLNNEKAAADAIANKGINHWALGAFDKALSCYKIAHEVYERLHYNKELSNLNNRIATVYYGLSDYTKAMNIYFQNLKIYEKLKDSLRLGTTLGNIGLCYANVEKNEKAIEYYNKAVSICENLSNKKYLADNYIHLGNVYDNMNKPDIAIENYQKALVISTDLGLDKTIANCQSNMGIAYTTQKNFIKGYDCLLQSMPFYRKSGNKYSLAVVYKSLGDIFSNAPKDFFTERKLNISLRDPYVYQYLDSSLKLYQEIEETSGEAEVWEMLSKYYSAKGNFKEALNAYTKYSQLKDSVFNDEKRTQVANLEAEYTFSKREDSIKADNEQMALAASSEIKRQSTLKQTTIIISSILFVAALASFIFYKRKRDAVEKQQEAEFKTEVTDTEMKALRAQMNPHFIFNSLNSISDYISKNNIPDADKYLSKFAKLMRLILENSEQKEIPLQDDLKALELYMQLEALRMKNKFTHSIDVDEVIDTSTTLVPPLILQPFVENSIWHGIAGKEGDGHINIRIKKHGNEMINCIVEDDGIGRKRSATTETASKEKTSLGMKITQERIDVLNKIKNTKAGVQLFDLEQGLRVEVKLPFVTI